MKLDDIIKALNELASLEVLRRDDGSYCCNLPGVEVGDGSVLVSPTEAAKTPKGAVLECWKNHTQLKSGEFVVVDAINPKKRRELLWNRGRWVPRVSAGPKRIRVRSAKDLVTK